MLTFTQWKSQQVSKDSLAAGVLKFYRPREWYYKAYGAYCKNFNLKE